MKRCPSCKREVHERAVKCRWCGEWQQGPPQETVDPPSTESRELDPEAIESSPPEDTQGSTEQWWVLRRGSQEGPFSVEKIHEAVRSGRLRDEHLVWRVGLSEWTPISEIRAQFPEAFLPSRAMPAPAQGGASGTTSAQEQRGVRATSKFRISLLLAVWVGIYEKLPLMESERVELLLATSALAATFFTFWTAYQFAKQNGLFGGWALAPLVGMLFGYMALWQRAKGNTRAARAWLFAPLLLILLALVVGLVLWFLLQ